MAKSVEAARARRRKEMEAQRQKEIAMWNKAKKPLLIAVIAIAVIVVGVILFKTFYVPANGVRVSNGAIVNVPENWIVANLGSTSSPSCYHLANVATPEGTTLDPDYDATGSTLLQARYFRVDDESSPVKSVYVVGAANKTADDMVATLQTNAYFTEVSEPKTVQIGDHYVKYIVAKMACYDSEGSTVEGMMSLDIYAYFDCAHGSSIGVCVISKDVSEETPYTEDDLLPILKQTIEGIELIK